MDSRIVDILKKNKIELETDVDLSKRTWIHRGPVVSLYILPHTAEEVEYVVRTLCVEGLTFKVIGHTSNLYFLNTYKIDAIVCTRKLTSVRHTNNTLICEAGVNVSKLSKQCVEEGILGFEGLVGLPGTVGAALVNNSSCFKCSISALMKSAEVLVIQDDGNVERQTFYYDDLGFEFRNSYLKSDKINAIVLSVELNKQTTNNIEELKKLAQNNIDHRTKTQEGKANNLGSVFSIQLAKPLTMSAWSTSRLPAVYAYRLLEHFFRSNAKYKIKRNKILLSLFGYSDVAPYVSPKNLNCFIWKDKGADAAFLRYVAFMREYTIDCKLEIEVCS